MGTGGGVSGERRDMTRTAMGNLGLPMATCQQLSPFPHENSLDYKHGSKYGFDQGQHTEGQWRNTDWFLASLVAYLVPSPSTMEVIICSREVFITKSRT